MILLYILLAFVALMTVRIIIPGPAFGAFIGKLLLFVVICIAAYETGNAWAMIFALVVFLLPSRSR